jgi:hypothetical protein
MPLTFNFCRDESRLIRHFLPPSLAGYQRSEPANVLMWGWGWGRIYPLPFNTRRPNTGFIALHFLCVLCDSVVNLFELVLAVNRITFVFAPSADHSRLPAEYALRKLQRRTHGSHSRHLCHFGGFSRATRATKMSIQRHTPSHPPAISAAIVQIVQQMQLLLSYNLQLASCN